MIGTNPGELVLHSLLKQFASVSQSKVESALDEKAENELIKCMRLQEDTGFQQLLNALFACAEHALPCLLQTISKWYDTQHSSGALYPFRRTTSKTVGARSQTLSAATGQTPAFVGGRDLLIRSMHVEGSSGSPPSAFGIPSVVSSAGVGEVGNGVYLPSATSVAPPERAALTSWQTMSTSARENMAERRDLCIDILYCQALISVLKQLAYHPGHDSMINKILDQAFRHFEYKENVQVKSKAENINTVADMYAKVVGELSQTRFNLVRHHFSTRLDHLRAKDSSPHTMHSIISLLMGMKFFRVKMHPIEEFVSYFTFLHELGQYFLEVKEKEIRHAMTCLFVEILLPVAAVVRHEVNIPALKNFVDLLYSPAFELANKKKHALSLFPMVTCLLCVGTKAFFLSNWPPFMSLCLSQLKNRDLGQVSIESLFRLLWVYVVRIKCEKHADTQNKLVSIVNGLFPKGSKSVLPKNVSSTVFVKIIHFIAQEKLDFAMTEIIFDLLGANRLQKLVLTPERMNIGLRAFLLIAHGLQQKDGEPPMPQNQPLAAYAVGGGVCPSVYARAPVVVRRSFHGTTLDDALCERLGIRPYLVPVRKAFEAILRLLEPQICRSMMPPKQGAPLKDGEDVTLGDRKPKIDLLKTCINCIPRLLPYEMSRTELIELLARVSLNVDEEIRMMAQQTMVNLIIESPAYRQRTIQAFIQFIQKYVPDTSPHQLDSCLKTLHTLLVNWKIALQRDTTVTTGLVEKSALVEAEGFALVMLCQCRPLSRRIAVNILRESRAVLHLINHAAVTQQQQQQVHEQLTQNIGSSAPASVAAASTYPVIDILDNLAPAILERILPLLPPNERHDLTSLPTVDFKSLAERSSPPWLCGPRQPSTLSHKPVLGATNLTTSALSSYVHRFSNGDLESAKPVTDQGHGNKVPLSTTITGKSGLKTSPDRTGRKSPVVSNATPNADPTASRPSTFCQCLLSPYLLQPQLDRTQLTDVWATALSVPLSTSNALRLHPAVLYAWNTVFPRLVQVFSLIDPNAQAAENRASSLLRSTSKKAPPSERDQLLPLWHNYVTLACCIAPSSTGVYSGDKKQPAYDADPAIIANRRRNLLRHMSNSYTGSADIALLPSHDTVMGSGESESTSVMSPRQQQYLTNSKLFISAKEKARDLVKVIIPLLRCEQPELRESVICGLSRIQPPAFRDVLEDLHPILRESVDLKQKNVQRRRRRDILRLSLIRLLALMAQNAVFQHDEAGIISNQGTLMPTLMDFIEGTRIYLESLNEPSAMVVTMFSSNTTTAPTATVGMGLGGATTSTLSSTAAITTSSLPSAQNSTAATSINSPGGTGASGGMVGGGVGTCVASGTSTPGVVGGTSGVVGSGGGSIGGPGGVSGVGGNVSQNSSVTAATTTPSATAAASAAPAHAPTGVDPVVLTEMRLYFCVFIRDLIRHLPRERRQRLLPPSIRRNLVLLIARWSGFYEHIYNSKDIKWSQPPWIDHSCNPLLDIKYSTPSPLPPPPPPPAGMDQVISGDLILSISGVHLESTPQDPFIAASFLDTSIWLELLWYANQSISALVCCGAIYDTLALFTTPTATHRLTETSDTNLNGSGVGHHFNHLSANSSATAVASTINTSTSSSTGPAASFTTAPTNGLVAEEEYGSLTMSTVPSAPLIQTSSQTLNVNALIAPLGSGFPQARRQPAPGYIFHWLKGLLLCRDAKLSISPWLWGLPVVNFGVCSTALKGPHAIAGVRNIKLEDNLRSIVIAAAAGRRLDSLFHQLGEETLVLLLDMNPDLSALLELLIDQCYTGSLNVIQPFFLTVTQLFIKNPETPCDEFTMLTLAMVFCEHPISALREHASFLLQTLYYRFFLLPSRDHHQRMHPTCKQAVTSTPAAGDSGVLNDSRTEFCLSVLADELLWREIGHWNPCDVLRQFCAQHPTCTLPMISEICKRLATASIEVRCRLIKLLHYWTINIELVDLFAQGSRSSNITCISGNGFMDAYTGLPENGSNTATLEPTPPFSKTDITTASCPSSSSEVEVEVRGITRRRSSPISSNSSALPSSASSPVSPSNSSSSASTSHSSSISTGSSNVDSSDCDSDTGAASNPIMQTNSQTDHKRQRRRKQVHEDNRRDNQQPSLEHPFKPEMNTGKQKANEFWATVPLTLRRSGWGCLKATEMVLNNFLYLTICFANYPNEAAALEELWVLLIRYRPANLRFILRYLIVAASLAPATLCSHMNRIVSFLANEDPSGVVEVLMGELQTIDGAGLMIEPSPFPPFFHIDLLHDLTEHNFVPSPVASAPVTATPESVDACQQRQTNLPEATTSSQREDEVYGSSTDRDEKVAVDAIHQTSNVRPLSTCSGDGVSSIKSTVELSLPSATTSAISRLTNRFASSATAMGRRALRTALYSSGGRQPKTPVSLDQEQFQELEIDSLDGDVEEECGTARLAADTMPTPQNHTATTNEALITARSRTLPYTAASRERYTKQAVVGMDGTPLNRPSRLRKILSRRRLTGGEKSSGNRRNPFRSIFRGGGGVADGRGSDIATLKNPELNENLSSDTRLFTTSLPPNLASLQPLPLPLHSHSISHINDYRKKRSNGRQGHLSSYKRQNSRHHHRRHRHENTSACGVIGSLDQRTDAQQSTTNLFLQQPLPMPREGSVYHAPMRDWFTEPFVTNGSLVFSGMWSPTGARSPLVLVLVGEILKSQNKHRVAWRRHMPLLLLCLFLGLDHCRPLVQEESKQLLVNMLRVICPRVDLLRLLSLQLETDAQWIARAMVGFASRSPQFYLTLDNSPCVPKFYLSASTDMALTEVSKCPTWEACCIPHSSSSIVATTNVGLSAFTASATPPGGLSPSIDAPPHPISNSGIKSRSPLVAQQSIVARPNCLFGSTYSLMSTATLIPAGLSAEQESKRRSVVLNDIVPSTLPLFSQLTSPSAQPAGVTPEKAFVRPVGGIAVAAAPHDCESRHLHRAAEKISQMLVEVQDRSVWNWEDITPSRFQQTTLTTLRSSLPPILPSQSSPQPRKTFHLLRSACFLDRFVRCVAEAFAEAEVEGRCEEAAACLRCQHGAPHSHNVQETIGVPDNLKIGIDIRSSQGTHQLQPECTVARFAQAAFNMGITCPNRHFASRSLQIYRALEAQLDEKSLSEVLVRFVELVSDTSEEVQGYMVELFLTLEAAVEHIQYRGTVLLSTSAPSISRSATRIGPLTRSSAPDSPLAASKPPQLVRSASPLPLPSHPLPSTPPVHERRHSRRGSTSSLSSLLGHSACLGGTTAAPTPSMPPVQPPIGLSVPPIKRPLMPPHAEAVIEEPDTLTVAPSAVSIISPVKPTQLPSTLYKPGCSDSAVAEAEALNEDARPISNLGDPLVDPSAIGSCRLAPEEQADLVAGIFWIGVCLLDSDYEYEYLAGIRLLSRLLACVCSSTSTTTPNNRKFGSQQQNLPDLHDHVLKLLHRLKWNTMAEDSDYPGLLGLLLKGCFSSTLIDPACRLLVHLIPAVKSPIVDPNVESRYSRRVAMSGTSRSTGSNTYPGSLSTLVITLLPMLLSSWDEDPDSAISTPPESAFHVGEAYETGVEGPGSPAVTSTFQTSSSAPPPLGSWVHRGVVISETAAASPSSGMLSLVTATIVSGAVAKKAPQLRPRNPICILAAEYLAELSLQTDAYRFNNLAIVLRLYANGTFSKDVNQWAKCVTRYLMDGCAGLGPRILAFFTAFLTLGPPCVQLPLLHFGYWFLQTVELNQSEMNSRIRAFITATSERFVNTPLWPEVTLLYQVVVTRSATLTAAPSNAGVYNLPGLDPSGSGRVLDSLAAAAAAAVPLPEAEPQRIALAGRVLDFDTSILQSAPLITGGRGQVSPRLGGTSTSVPNQRRSPTRSTNLVESCVLTAFSFNAFFRLGAWKSPWNRQARLRGLFSNFLSCFGSQLDHLTAPRSPSNSSRQKVIFSQSTETLDRQLSMHSSSETTSINDASNPDDGRFDDTSSAERAAVFHDLDTYLDAQLMNINFLDLPRGTWEDQSRCPWGVRGHSITSHTEFNDEVEDQQNPQPHHHMQIHKQQLQTDQCDASLLVSSEDTSFQNDFTRINEKNYIVPAPVLSNSHSQQHRPIAEADDLEMEDAEEEEEDEEADDEEEDELDEEGGEFLIVSSSAATGAIIERQSQLSLQLSSSVASSPAAPSMATVDPATSATPKPDSFLAPSTLNQIFNSQLLIEGNSRVNSPIKWLPDAPSTTDMNWLNTTNNASMRQWPEIPPLSRKRTFSMQPPVICSRRRRQNLTALGGSLDSLSNQPNGENAVVQEPKSLAAVKCARHSSSPSPSPKIPATICNNEAEVDESSLLSVKPRHHGRSLRSLDVTTCDPPPLPLRLCRSSNALDHLVEVANTSSALGVTAEQLIIPTPSETAWITCHRQLNSLQQTAVRGRMMSAQSDRLRLLLTGLRSTFSGMLRRSTFQAVEVANLAFFRCPPSSDLDSEIRISNLVKIAEIIRGILPVPFFEIHPNSIPLLDEHFIHQCLQLGKAYREWEEAVEKLYVVCSLIDLRFGTCAPSERTDWQQLERICCDLQEVLHLLVAFFRHCTYLLIGAQHYLVALPVDVTNFSSTLVEPLFARLRSYLLSLPPPLLSNLPNIRGMEAWKEQCARLLLRPLRNSSSPEEVDIKHALAVYATAMKLTDPITMDNIMDILGACCEQLWTEPNIESGVALIFAQSQTMGVSRSEASASTASAILAKGWAPTLLSTDNLFASDGRTPLPPLELADQLLHLLEVQGM